MFESPHWESRSLRGNERPPFPFCLFSGTRSLSSFNRSSQTGSHLQQGESLFIVSPPPPHLPSSLHWQWIIARGTAKTELRLGARYSRLETSSQSSEMRCYLQIGNYQCDPLTHWPTDRGRCYRILKASLPTHACSSIFRILWSILNFFAPFLGFFDRGCTLLAPGGNSATHCLGTASRTGSRSASRTSSRRSWVGNVN